LPGEDGYCYWDGTGEDYLFIAASERSEIEITVFPRRDSQAEQNKDRRYCFLLWLSDNLDQWMPSIPSTDICRWCDRPCINTD